MLDLPTRYRGTVVSAWLWSIVLGIGCGRSTPQAGDSESHFLTRCEAECPGSLTCLCGVCTSSCAARASCAAFAGGATCESADSLAACGQDASRAGICAVTCQRDGDCRALGARYTCSAGLCSAAPHAFGETADPVFRLPLEVRQHGDAAGCWSRHTTFPPLSRRAFEVGDGLMVIGQDGSPWFFDGSVWSELPFRLVTNISQPAWGSAADDLYFVDGAYAAVMHFDGRQVREVHAPAEGALVFAVYGFSADDVWAAARRRDCEADCDALVEVYHFDGSAWTTTVLEERVAGGGGALWGNGPEDLWIAAGDHLFHREGARWEASAPNSRLNVIKEIGPLAGGGVYALETNGLYAFHDARWSELVNFNDGSNPKATRLVDVVAAPDDSLYAAGEDGEVYRWDGDAFQAVIRPTLI